MKLVAVLFIFGILIGCGSELEPAGVANANEVNGLFLITNPPTASGLDGYLRVTVQFEGLGVQPVLVPATTEPKLLVPGQRLRLKFVDLGPTIVLCSGRFYVGVPPPP